VAVSRQAATPLISEDQLAQRFIRIGSGSRGYATDIGSGTLAAHGHVRAGCRPHRGSAGRADVRLLTRLRGARVFHPHGRAYATEVEVGPTAPIAPGRYRGIVRLSRGLGLPEPWPDVLGLAVRMLNADGVGGMQDLLLVSSLPAVAGRHVILPGRGYGGAFYSSVLPVRTGSRTMIVGALPVWTGHPQPLARLAEIDRAVGSALRGFDLLLAGPVGAWSHLARVDLTRALPAQDSEAVRFDPYHQAAGLAPAGVLNALRRRSYAASQRARQYRDAPTPAVPR
jgi:hypothetical protein